MRKVTIGLLLLLVVQACEFKLDDTHFVEVAPPSKNPAINVYITNPGFEDPFYLEQTTTFKVKVESPVNELLSGQVTVGQQEVTLSRDANGDLQFTLAPGQFATGTYPVAVRLDFRTGTGSMADLAMAEAYVYEATFDIIVERSAPVLKAPVTAAMENGYLTLRWSVTDNRSRSYEIYKDQLNDPYETILKRDKVRFAGDAVYIDSGYVGNPTIYSIYGMVSESSALVSNIEVRIEPTTFTVVNSADGARSRLEWSTLLRNANITVVSATSTKTVSIQEGGVTMDSLLLGRNSIFSVSINRNNHPLQSYRNLVEQTKKLNVSMFYDVEAVDANHFVLAGLLYLKRYRFSDLTATDSTSQPYQLTDLESAYDSPTIIGYSGNAGSGPWYVTTPLAAPPTYVRMAVKVLGDNNQVWGTTVSPLGASGLSGINFQHNNISWAGIADRNADVLTDPGNAIVWYDSANNDTPVVSPDGAHFALNTRDQSKARIFRKNGSQWSQVGQIPAGRRSFRGMGSNELIVFTAQDIQVFDVTANPASPSANYSAVRSFPYPALAVGHQRSYAGFDRQSQLIVLQTISPGYRSTFRTYHVQTFALVETASAYVPPSQPAIRHLYANHHHFLSNGFAEKIR